MYLIGLFILGVVSIAENILKVKREVAAEFFGEDPSWSHKALTEANDAKVEDNTLFKDGQDEEALSKYDIALPAVSNMTKVLEVDPSYDQARRQIVRLKPLADEKRQKMKEEMIVDHWWYELLWVVAVK
ncbi:uncharacterized protein [Coffea arabica]|uniref:Uncharacterized protein n=1 Tax=Coffea arabica TaxID=13443 RepID=A0ABM4W354_COFAR